MKLMFNVCHQMCVRQDMQTAVADSTNYLMAKFTFETEDWNNTTKTAVFKNGPLVKNVILDANNECAVPAEVIDASYLYVSVFGVKDPGYRITTNFAMVQIDKSGYLEGDGAGEITPSQVEQLEGAIAEKTGPNDFKTINGQNIVGSGNLVIEGSGTEVVANPEGTATDSLTKIQIGEEILNIPSGGTNVEANPSGTPAASLEKIEIAGVIYNGLKGDKGDNGDDYVLTSADKAEIAQIVETEIPAVEANPSGSASANLTKVAIGNNIYAIPSGGSNVEANPTMAGTEAHLEALEIDGVKFLNAKLDASLATVITSGENLFDIATSKANWKPTASTSATYSDGSESTNSYTTNLISANKTDKSKFKMNFSSQPSYYRTFFYDSNQVWKGGTNNLQQDEDGLYYIDISTSQVSGFSYICLVFTTTDATMFSNLVVKDYDRYGDAKTIINDLYLSDNNVAMAKERLGILSDNILEGKKWAVAGDSFTEGGWASGEAPLIPSGKYAGQKAVYPYIIGNRNNMTIQNIFRAGRTLAHPSDDSFTNTFADNYQNIDADADYLTIYLGINDSHHRPNAYGSDGEDTTGEITLGTITDNTTATFYGAWNVILTWMITNRPNLKIGIIASNACETDDYRTATIAIAKKYGIPYIDLNGDERTPCMIRSTNADVASDIKTLRTNNWRISSSNSHPNEACQIYEASIIENFLRTL